MKTENVYIVVALESKGPRILGVYKNERTAEKVAASGSCWCNVIKQELK